MSERLSGTKRAAKGGSTARTEQVGSRLSSRGSTLKKRRKTKAASRKRYCDNLLRKVVMQRDGVCQMGPEDCWGELECAHIFPRRAHSVRWNPLNAVLLCQKHHRWFDEAGMERWAWVIERLGEKEYEALVAEKAREWDRDYDRVATTLRGLL